MVVTSIYTWREVGITAVISIAFTPSVGETPLSLRKTLCKKNRARVFPYNAHVFVCVFVFGGVHHQVMTAIMEFAKLRAVAKLCATGPFTSRMGWW